MRNLTWPRRHSYRASGFETYYGHVVPKYTCVFCNRHAGLERWQIRNMPRALAACPNGVRLTLRQIVKMLFTDAVDCYESPRRSR